METIWPHEINEQLDHDPRDRSGHFRRKIALEHLTRHHGAKVELARSIGYKKGSIVSDWISGRKYMSNVNLFKAATVLEVNPFILLDWDEYENRNISRGRLTYRADQLDIDSVKNLRTLLETGYTVRYRMLELLNQEAERTDEDGKLRYLFGGAEYDLYWWLDRPDGPSRIKTQDDVDRIPGDWRDPLALIQQYATFTATGWPNNGLDPTEAAEMMLELTERLRRRRHH